MLNISKNDKTFSLKRIKFNLFDVFRTKTNEIRNFFNKIECFSIFLKNIKILFEKKIKIR